MKKQAFLVLLLITQITPVTYTGISKSKEKRVASKVSSGVYTGGSAFFGVAAVLSALVSVGLLVGGVDDIRVKHYGYGDGANSFLFGDELELKATVPLSFLSSLAFSSLAYNCATLAYFFHKKSREVSEEKSNIMKNEV